MTFYKLLKENNDRFLQEILIEMTLTEKTIL